MRSGFGIEQDQVGRSGCEIKQDQVVRSGKIGHLPPVNLLLLMWPGNSTGQAVFDSVI